MQCEWSRNYCVLQCILLAGVSVFKDWKAITTRKSLLPRATSIEDENVARFKNQNVQETHGFGTPREVLCRTLRKCEGAWPILVHVQKYCILQVKKGLAKGTQR